MTPPPESREQRIAAFLRDWLPRDARIAVVLDGATAALRALVEREVAEAVAAEAAEKDAAFRAGWVRSRHYTSAPEAGSPAYHLELAHYKRQREGERSRRAAPQPEAREGGA